MVRRWAIGEIYSQFFQAPDEESKKETLRLLTSENSELEVEGIERFYQQSGREAFVASIQEGKDWFLSKMSLSSNEFQLLRTNNSAGWGRYSAGTFKLVDAANFLQANSDCDPRVKGVIAGCKRGTLEMTGITLVEQTPPSSYTIVEGNARLVALYLCCVVCKSGPYCGDSVEVVLGVSGISSQVQLTLGSS
jgi:hypothetical protein